MVLILSKKFVAICEPNTENIWSELSLIELMSGNKCQISINLSQFVSNEDKNKDKNEGNVDKTNYTIVCGNFSENSQLLSICDSSKNLMVFRNIENNWTQIFITKVSRNCIKVLFSLNKKSVICGHKSGDVYEYDFESSGVEETTSGRLLLGHCSMLLDLIQSQDSKYLITCDRDEKIRVSYYPNSYNIQSYCLGHKEFVSTIDTINNETLISGSGDGSLRIWNICDGKQLDVLMCDPNESIEENHKNGTKFAVKKLVTNRKTGANYLAVSFYKQSMVKIYSNDCLSLKLIHKLSLDKEPINLFFDCLETDILWLLLNKSQNPIEIYKISSENITKSDIYENAIKELNNNENFKNQCLKDSKSGELSGLYKHWFNNVETYLQKKFERQEVMTKKKKFTLL